MVHHIKLVKHPIDAAGVSLLYSSVLCVALCQRMCECVLNTMHTVLAVCTTDR